MKFIRNLGCLSAILSISALANPAIAYQIPTTTNALWSGTNVTTGVGNTVPATKDTPSGVRVKVTVAGSGTNIFARNNTTLMTSGNSTTPALPGTTNGLQLLSDMSNCPNGLGVLTCPNLGTFSIEFLDTSNTPLKVRNPIVHWSRLGGAKSLMSTVNGVTTTKSFLQTVVLQLTTPNLKFGTASGSSLAVSTGINNNIRWAMPATSATPGVCSTAASDAGCGSTPILNSSGTAIFTDRLDFSVSNQRTNDTIAWNEVVNGAASVTQDGYFLTVSFEEDYGDAPASFDPITAASHVITDLTLGASVDAENPTVANGGADGATSVTPSPKVVAAGTDNTGTNGDGIDDDGIASFPPLSTTQTGTTYSVPVALSGASRAGRVCGWIDFNRNGTFDNATERACGDFVAGAATVNLNWTVPAGITVGNNYVRVRTSYDITGVQNPTGRLNSGEVEDYRIAITAPAPLNNPPTTTDLNAASQPNPGSTTAVQVTTLAGSDLEDGPLGAGKRFKIESLPTNGTLSYNNAPVLAGQMITNYDPTLLKLDPNDGAISVSFTYAAIDSTGQADLSPATVIMPFIVTSSSIITISGMVFSDADANIGIDGSDAGTNAGSASLTIYAIDNRGKVVDKATVTANGTYSLTNVPQNTALTLLLSNNATVAIGALAPTVTSLPTDWYHTGEILNGVIDSEISTLGDIALAGSTSNIVGQDFGIRQGTIIAADPATTTCNPDYRTTLNTGISAAGDVLPVGANDLNWTVEWIPGPTSGPETPYATPRPIGPMPAVVVGNLALGAWVNEPANAHWISYPFRLSSNSNGDHNDADLDGRANEGINPMGTSDTVRLKYTSSLTLPINANITSISVPVGVSVDNQFVSIKVNGVENLVPTPAQNPNAADFITLNQLNITQGWQAGVNRIEIITESGPPLTGFFLSVQVTSTQVCPNASPNLLLVKRITAINGGTTTVGGDSLAGYIDTLTNPYDDNDATIATQPTPASPPKDTDKWPDPSTFLLGGINGGNIKPGDEMEYTIYFLSSGDAMAKNVLFCDRVPDDVSFLFNGYGGSSPLGLTGTEKGIELFHNGTTTALSNVPDSDLGQYFSPGVDPKATYPNVNCRGANTNGAVVVDLGNLPNATAVGTPAASYGFVRFKGRVK
jgi:uncharacterized repeat protein (TIGR01451 family)